MRIKKSFSSFDHLSITLNREWRLFWAFTKRDLLFSVLSGSIFMLVALYTQVPTLPKLGSFLGGILYLTLYLYQFNVSNQIHGLEEDRINKPDRPLVSGLISLEEASIRYMVLVFLYLALSILLQVFWWTVLWVIATYLHNARGWHQHWFTKNIIIMSVGTFVQLGASWCIMAPLSATTFAWIAAVSLWGGTVILIQDFRDQEGDQLLNRKTLPLSFGDANARKIIMVVWTMILLYIIGVFLFLSIDAFLTTSYLFCLLFIFGHLAIMLRLWKYRTPEEDKLTYNLLGALYCVLLISSVCIRY